MNKKMKIEVMKGAFSIVPKDVRAMIMREMITAVQDGTLLAKSRPVDMKKLKREEPKVYADLMKQKAAWKGKK